MAITVESIIEDVLESVEWAFQHNELHSHQIDFSDAIHEAIDSALVYTSDILEYWVRAGMPDCEDGMSDGTIMGAITWAVYEDLRANVSDYDVLGRFVESHAGTLEEVGADVSTMGEEAAYALLVDYMDAGCTLEGLDVADYV